MARVWVILLALFGSSPIFAEESGPWDEFPVVPTAPSAYPWGDETPQHAWEGGDGYYWIFERDISRAGGHVTAWVREKRKVPASDGTVRTLTRLTFDCEGRFRFSAQSRYRADDAIVQEIDRLDEWTFVRPDSGYDTFQKALCQSG